MMPEEPNLNLSAPGLGRGSLPRAAAGRWCRWAARQCCLGVRQRLSPPRQALACPDHGHSWALASVAAGPSLALALAAAANSPGRRFGQRLAQHFTFKLSPTRACQTALVAPGLLVRLPWWPQDSCFCVSDGLPRGGQLPVIGPTQQAVSEITSVSAGQTQLEAEWMGSPPWN